MTDFKKLDTLLQGFMENGPAGCACAVYRHGEQLYGKCFGYADLESRTPITMDTIYRFYSVSKVVTCTSALLLYERGKFLMNDPLYEYLPEFRNMQVCRYTPVGELYLSPAARPILVRDLFTMTTGYTYPDGSSETSERLAAMIDGIQRREAAGEKIYLKDFSEAIAQIPLAFDPGTYWKYSFSHDILGRLIEVLSGKSLGQFMKDEIFDPLGMHDTFFRIPDEKKNRLSSLYGRTADGRLVKDTSRDKDYQPGAVFESGGGGLLSTIPDFSRFAHMMARGGEFEGTKIIGRKTIELMGTNQLGKQQLTAFDWSQLAGYGYGLGVRVMTDPAAGGCNCSLGEFGWGGLAGTWVSIDPKEELSYVFAQQMIPCQEHFYQPRIRNLINSCI